MNLLLKSTALSLEASAERVQRGVLDWRLCCITSRVMRQKNMVINPGDPESRMTVLTRNINNLTDRPGGMNTRPATSYVSLCMDSIQGPSNSH